MAWDSARPVPWARLAREWVVYAAIMTVVFLVFFRDSNVVGAIAGLLISGPLYLALGATLAKLGYQRQTIKEMRAARMRPRDERRTDGGRDEPADRATRTRPPPTRRTSTGPSQRPRPKRKR